MSKHESVEACIKEFGKTDEEVAETGGSK